MSPPVLSLNYTYVLRIRWVVELRLMLHPENRVCLKNLRRRGRPPASEPPSIFRVSAHQIHLLWPSIVLVVRLRLSGLVPVRCPEYVGLAAFCAGNILMAVQDACGHGDPLVMRRVPQGE